MSIRDFAAHLGISDRMVSKWEAGGANIRPRPVNQAALDTSLARSGSEAQARFGALLETLDDRPHAVPAMAVTPPPRPVRNPADGKMMAKIDQGVFLSGSDQKPIWLPEYFIDIYPVTNDDYARFVAATGHPVPPHWAGGVYPDDRGHHPVVFVTWSDATAYASWAGKCLPSGHEWEKAARGAGGQIYPWGDSASPAKCNVRESSPGSTTPVDRYHSGVSSYGVYDLCGNVWEWCRTETDPGRHELKGSAFTSSFTRAAPSAFNDADATMSDDDTGFRCVATALAG
jgi:formylglycine-generating enzyme required for sulfatase activity